MGQVHFAGGTEVVMAVPGQTGPTAAIKNVGHAALPATCALSAARLPRPEPDLIETKHRTENRQKIEKDHEVPIVEE